MDGIGQRDQAALVTSDQFQVTALAGERDRQPLADALGRARDQCFLAVQTEVHVVPSCSK
ncbi:hypothetical protein D9M68_766650 [compost metagenome]